MRAGNRTTLPERIGPFTILHRLGAGGMAETFAAVRRGPGGFEQRVCVKRVLPGYATDDEVLRLFLREARLAATLSHRNVTQVLQFGQDRGEHYLAMELVEGMDLRRLLRAAGPRLPLEVSLFVASEIAEGLEHAHSRGGATGPIVHRDVSPANTLLGVDGDVKLTDFGISKALHDAPLTRSNVRGNIWYLAPEQLEASRQADPRSDLFSLGVVLYRCLSGKRPYQGSTDLATMRALSEGRIVPLRESAPDVAEPVRVIVDRLLAHAPAQRYPAAAHVAAALAPHFDPRRARIALAQLVRAHRAPDERRRRVRVAMPDPELPRDGLEPPLAPVLRDRPRWTHYAHAPRTWASAPRAAEQRRRDNRPLPLVDLNPPPSDVDEDPLSPAGENPLPAAGAHPPLPIAPRRPLHVIGPSPLPVVGQRRPLTDADPHRSPVTPTPSDDEPPNRRSSLGGLARLGAAALALAALLALVLVAAWVLSA